MAATVVQVRMDEELKEQSSLLFEELGLDLPTAIRIFLKKSLAVSGIPFEVQSEVPNVATRKAMENVERGVGLSRPFSSVQELMEDLNADDPV